jgi:hypothetical protein
VQDHERLKRFESFRKELVHPDELSATSRDFFGAKFFTDQESIFPEWMSKRQDFRSKFPRFCSDAD